MNCENTMLYCRVSPGVIRTVADYSLALGLGNELSKTMWILAIIIFQRRRILCIGIDVYGPLIVRAM